MTIDLTKEEANALLALLDVAVKAVGLNGAGAALQIATKVQTAMNEQQEKPNGQHHAIG